MEFLVAEARRRSVQRGLGQADRPHRRRGDDRRGAAGTRRHRATRRPSRPRRVGLGPAGLVDQRVGLLPLGGDASFHPRLSENKAASIAATFVEWPRRREPLDAHHISETIISFTPCCYDGDRPEHRLDPPGWVWRYSTSDYRGGRIILRRLSSVPDSGTGPNAGSYGRLRAAVAVVWAGRPPRGPAELAGGLVSIGCAHAGRSLDGDVSIWDAGESPVPDRGHRRQSPARPVGIVVGQPTETLSRSHAAKACSSISPPATASQRHFDRYLVTWPGVRAAPCLVRAASWLGT